MQAFGVITEYNPFHLGHAYQLNSFRKDAGSDLLMVLMSGNVVQRGEFAIVDKWMRAEMALKGGADLVVEAPLLSSLQAADEFAKVNVSLLDRLGCQTFGFGAESADLGDFKYYLAFLDSHQTEIDQEVQLFLKEGLSYAAAFHQAVLKVGWQLKRDVNSLNKMALPNHMLGIQYLLANQELDASMSVKVLTRRKFLQGQALSSGSQIRNDLLQGKHPSQLPLPDTSQKLICQASLVTWSDYFPLLRYQLFLHTPKSLSQIFGVREGIEYRLLKEVNRQKDYSSYIDSLTSKRWTQSSLQRILLAVLLNITWDDWLAYKHNFWKNPYLRVLAFNSKGRQYLNEMRSQSSLHLFTNLREGYMAYSLNLKADRIYHLNPRQFVLDQIHGRYPIIRD